MEKKNNSGILVGILIGIVIAVIVVGGLFVTKTISFTNKENINNKEEKQNVDNEGINATTDEEKATYQITYEEEEYTTKRTDGTEVSKSTRNLPKITNAKNQMAADKITKFLTDRSNEEWENNIKKMADQVIDLPYDGLGVKYLYETGVITNNRLTFTLSMNGGFGGVGWLSEEGYNFDTKTGEVLTTKTVAENDEELKQYMLKKVTEKIEELKKVEGNCINENYQKNLEEEINRVGNWYFTTSEIKIKLQKYSIACGAGGIIEIILPKEEANKYLKEIYKI